MGKNLTRQYFIIAILLSLAIGIIIHFPMVMNYIFGEGGRSYNERFIITFAHLGTELVITFIVALLMFILNFFILNPVEKHGKIRLLRFVLAITITVISVYLLNHILFSLKNIIDPQIHRQGFRRIEFDYMNFFVSSLVVGCVLIVRLIFQRQNILFENESYRREALQHQYESLKNQLSPHFMFNSLTALKVLIDEAPDKAQNYVNSLSKALHYTLQSSEKRLVTLKEEIEFMESYLFLIKMRFATNIAVHTSINESLVLYRLPPLTVQTLVENAIKHNEISKRKPLSIYINTSENVSLIVENDIQKKIGEEDGTGIGLENLSSQFRLIIGKEITIRQENNRFSVEVPLIKP